MAQKDIAIIGGGASGIMAALTAAGAGARAVIWEKNPRIGRKLLATGNGRCNLTNVNAQSACYHGGHPGFAASALSLFSAAETLELFESLGITCKVEERGKVFPRSDQASSVLDVLRHELEALEVQVRCDAPVTALEKTGGHFILTCQDGSRHLAAKVILAAGGKATPALSSPGLGYPLAEKMGHRIVTPFPALVPLKLEAPFLNHVHGVKWEGKVLIYADEKPVASDSGEILFTEYGLSGPPVLAVSRAALSGVREGRKVQAAVNLVPEMSPGDLRNYLSARLGRCRNKSLSFALVGFINKRLIGAVLSSAGCRHPEKPGADLGTGDLERLSSLLQDWRFPVTGSPSWTHAQVTAGGIDTRDIDAATLQSKHVPGLFFAGEIIDIDGDCGGFNLQWAWSSGRVAGRRAAE
ncbi:MAG: NAD(P)/FAD-dependent oxidoreductase [Candidatus Eremiobacteraeota bacterium]|nr:NAD(P)/FAD-dependent oxidoreductase [Candidatus Eremiobacteraeota bacterium]